jgi:carboxyl-terminal processing protease
MKGLILDLRDNPGGLLSAAVEISDLFLDGGEIVSTKGRNTIPKSYVAQKDSLYEDFPIAILINQNSASASEIVSAALQDHKRAEIVGQRSYGKGSVQNILELEDGNSVLKLTVASYYRPSGENIHRFRNAKPSDKWGVTPNPGLEVKLTIPEYIEWFKGRRDRDLDSAAKGHRKPLDDAKDGAEEKNNDQKAEDKGKDAEANANAKGAKDEAPAETKKPEAGEGQAKESKEEAKDKAGTSKDEAKKPFVDKQLEKALEVIRARLAKPAEEKPAPKNAA